MEDFGFPPRFPAEEEPKAPVKVEVTEESLLKDKAKGKKVESENRIIMLKIKIILI